MIAGRYSDSITTEDRTRPQCVISERSEPRIENKIVILPTYFQNEIRFQRPVFVVAIIDRKLFRSCLSHSENKCFCRYTNLKQKLFISIYIFISDRKVALV